MTNLLIYTDLHISNDSLEECKAILDEILILCDKHSITKVISAGDNFDTISPNSECLDLFSSFVKKLNRPIIILAANSHESTTIENSVLNHFGILHDKVEIVKEYIDGDSLYVGHFIVQQSKNNYGGTKNKEDLNQYKHVVLGHGHNGELIPPNICQLGSSRFVDFGERKDEAKKVAICLNYRSEYEKWVFIPLNSAIPMKDFMLGENEKKGIDNECLEAQSPKFASTKPLNPSTNQTISDLSTKLDQLSPKTKVRILFYDFNLWKEYLAISHQYKNKFVVYKEEKKFITNINSQISVANEQKVTIKDYLKKWIKINKIDKVIANILLGE